MTPAARIEAAIGVLDAILSGAAVERVLTNWARANRFAGSGDRAAIRDHVYDALRQRRSLAALGGGETGRGLMLGLARSAGMDVPSLFTGQGHAPAPVQQDETGRAPTEAEARNLPDWLWPVFERSLGAEATAIALSLQSRAPVYLRVNLLKSNVAKAIAALAQDQIVAEPHNLAETALIIRDGARKVQTSKAYQDGLVELQDASSQAVIEALPLTAGMKVLDYCAGGGGKTLAMAAKTRGIVHAHDAFPDRMRDLPIRAKRAGAKVEGLSRPEKAGLFDLVLADAPCSGSGSWRRDPQGKWLLTEERLAEITTVQQNILDRISSLVRPGGWLAYATCSLLDIENDLQITAFLSRNGQFSIDRTAHFTPLSEGDGFFLAILRRSA